MSLQLINAKSQYSTNFTRRGKHQSHPHTLHSIDGPSFVQPTQERHSNSQLAAHTSQVLFESLRPSKRKPLNLKHYFFLSIVARQARAMVSWGNFVYEVSSFDFSASDSAHTLLLWRLILSSNKNERGVSKYLWAEILFSKGSFTAHHFAHIS